MGENADLEKLLKLSGFTEYEKKVYRALYRKKEAAPREVSKAAEVPRNRVYEVLDDLNSRGYVSEVPGENKRYRLIDPSTAFSEQVEKKKREAEIMEEISEAASKEPEREDVFLEIMQNRENVLNHLKEELEKVEEEYLTMGKIVSSYTPLQPVMKQKVEEGVPIKILGPEKGSRDTVVKKYQEIGAEIRLREMKASPFRFSIYDGERTALTLTKKGKGYTTIWTNKESITRNLESFFYSHWEKSKEPDF